MKRALTRPQFKAEQFVPNEYISTCIEGSTSALNGMWEETNKIPGCQQSRHNLGTEKRFMPYADVAVRDPEVPTSSATDTLYSNAAGWFSIRLKTDPYNVSQAADNAYDVQVYVFEAEEGTFYQTWRPGTEYFTNRS